MFCIISGDELYPANVDYTHELTKSVKTVAQWRENVAVINRVEKVKKEKAFILKTQNCAATNHIDLGEHELKVYASNV